MWRNCSKAGETPVVPGWFKVLRSHGSLGNLWVGRGTKKVEKKQIDLEVNLQSCYVHDIGECGWLIWFCLRSTLENIVIHLGRQDHKSEVEVMGREKKGDLQVSGIHQLSLTLPTSIPPFANLNFELCIWFWHDKLQSTSSLGAMSCGNPIIFTRCPFGEERRESFSQCRAPSRTFAQT